MYDSVNSRHHKTAEKSNKNLQIFSEQPTVEQQAVAYAKFYTSTKRKFY